MDKQAIAITEWYEQAKGMTMEELPIFLNHLMTDCQHDYGTVCHALTAGALATLWAMNHTDQGGITGFQAGAIMWEFIRHWNYSSNKTGLRIVDYDNFLYPQYEDKFRKVISLERWVAIQEEAARQIAESDKKHAQYLVDMYQYHLDFAAFVEKYPDYHERPEYYDRLCYGTGDEWDAYHRKEANGFEFAPNKPFEPLHTGRRVYDHWVSIVNGVVPFGYCVGEED